MSGLIGFNCKKCDKPFFVMRNTPQDILDDAKSLKKYQKQGFSLVDITVNIGNIENWCRCNEKQSKKVHQ